MKNVKPSMLLSFKNHLAKKAYENKIKFYNFSVTTFFSRLEPNSAEKKRKHMSDEEETAIIISRPKTT